MPSTQKGLSKSRVGCTNCRAKRIKCDETKPRCQVCARRGKVCTGYQRELRWSTKYEVNLDKSVNGPPNLRDLVRSTSQSVTRGETSSNDETDTVSALPNLAIDESEDIFDEDPVVDGESWMSSEQGPTFEDISLQTGDSDAVSYYSHNQEFEERNAALEDVWPDQYDMHFPDLEFDVESQPIVVSQLEGSGEATSPHKVTSHPKSKSKNKTMTRIAENAYALGADQVIKDVPTFLIEYWFENICQIWSGFDSTVNMNRQFALSSFPHHEGLFYSLQSMAASYLADRLPHLKRLSLVTTHQAVQAIKLEIASLLSTNLPDALPRGLLLAMFCMGTSACWTVPAQLGLPMLRAIKTLLARYNERSAELLGTDREALVFFNQSCLYWDTLCRVVADPEDALGPSWSQSRLGIGPFRHQFHPWTGMSVDVMELFAKSIALCRQFRRRVRQLAHPTITALQASLEDFREARRLRQDIEALQIPETDLMLDTKDQMTPPSHYAEIGKAYRLAALLHLRQTFKESTGPTGTTNADSDNHQELLDIALDIIHILADIPITSNTHSLQPVLLLSASTGLRFDIPPREIDHHSLPSIDDLFTGDLLDNNPSFYPPSLADNSSEASVNMSMNMNLNLRMPLSMPMTMNASEINISKAAIEVGNARQFVQERLNVLEKRLAARPIVIVKELVQRTWLAYDRDHTVHWVDVMTESGLRTIFG